MSQRTAQWLLDIFSPLVRGSSTSIAMSETEPNEWIVTISGDGEPGILSTEKHATDFVQAVAMVNA